MGNRRLTTSTKTRERKRRTQPIKAPELLKTLIRNVATRIFIQSVEMEPRKEIMFITIILGKF